MGTVTETAIRPLNGSRQNRWQGRSGRVYGLATENLSSFAMDEWGLYLIAKGSHVLWVGSASDLVADPMSRSRFRLALDLGDRAFRLDATPSEAERWATIWDLEGAEQRTEAAAA
jgi:hypothetical protein